MRSASWWDAPVPDPSIGCSGQHSSSTANIPSLLPPAQVHRLACTLSSPSPQGPCSPTTCEQLCRNQAGVTAPLQVDGPLSVYCYLATLDQCYLRYCKKFEKRFGR